jgi:hypothetical protein
MFCSHCGKQIADNARFCNHCGLSQPELPSQPYQPFHQSYQPSPQPYQPSPQPYQPSPQPYQQSPQPYQPSPQSYQQSPQSYPQTFQGYTQSGFPTQSGPEPYSTGYGLIGFSPKINDPAFAKYKKSSSKYALIFAVVLAIIAMVGMPIYGSASGEVEFPQSLYYGMILGGMFLLIAIVQTLRKGTDSTWDGVVIDKRSARRTQRDDDSTVSRHYIEYRFTVRRESGKKYNHTFRDQPAMYNYYQEGDRVRHHKGSTYYEKYDKSRDSEILCAACLTMNPISDQNCRRCKCPLLKC